MKRLFSWPFRLLRLKLFVGRSVLSSAENSWSILLHSLANEIDAVNKSTEPDFLEIGSKLQHFYEAAKKISQVSASTAELLAGQEVRDAIDGLRHISTNMERVASDSRRHSEQFRALLGMVEEAIGALYSFQKYVQRLNLICVTTRIEIAHIGSCETDFDTLAEGIHKLTEEIETKSRAILDRLEPLSDLIRQNLSRIMEIEECRQDQTRTVLDQASLSLSTLTEQYEKSLSTARRIADGYDELSGITGEIVCSLQFHDITRQQIEHAAESLRRLAGARQEMGNEHADLCELQSLQIRFAGKKFAEEVERIIGNLRSTTQKIEEITGELVKLAGGTRLDQSGPHPHNSIEGQEQSGFLCKTGERLSHVGVVLGEYAEKNRDLISATQSISEALQEVSSFVGKIRQIGLAIRLIALNSIVKSSQVGERGAALEVVANEIHNLSLGTGRLTQQISDAFESISASTLQINAGAAGENGSQEEETADEMIKTLDQLARSLSAANSSVTSQVAVITGTAGNLTSEIEATASQIDVHERVSAAIDEIASKLDAAVAGLRTSSHLTGESESGARKAELMERIEQNYTMNSEREIHQLVGGSTGSDATTEAPVPRVETDAAGEQSAESADSSCSEESEFGENVELF
jgi:methyl-accepting chemotaxis protein